jgi:hypothetical protein
VFSRWPGNASLIALHNSVVLLIRLSGSTHATKDAEIAGEFIRRHL